MARGWRRGVLSGWRVRGRPSLRPLTGAPVPDTRSLRPATDAHLLQWPTLATASRPTRGAAFSSVPLFKHCGKTHAAQSRPRRGFPARPASRLRCPNRNCRLFPRTADVPAPNSTPGVTLGSRFLSPGARNATWGRRPSARPQGRQRTPLPRGGHGAPRSRVTRSCPTRAARSPEGGCCYRPPPFQRGDCPREGEYLPEVTPLVSKASATPRRTSSQRKGSRKQVNGTGDHLSPKPVSRSCY